MSQLGNARVNRLVEKGPPTTDDEEGETRLKMFMTKMKANMMYNATKQNKKLLNLFQDIADDPLGKEVCLPCGKRT